MHIVLEMFGRRFEMASAYRKVEDEEVELEEGEEVEHLAHDPHSVPHASAERAYPPFEHAGVNELPARMPFGFASSGPETVHLED
jgi:hypothetical protein